VAAFLAVLMTAFLAVPAEAAFLAAPAEAAFLAKAVVGSLAVFAVAAVLWLGLMLWLQYLYRVRQL